MKRIGVPLGFRKVNSARYVAECNNRIIFPLQYFSVQSYVGARDIRSKTTYSHVAQNWDRNASPHTVQNHADRRNASPHATPNHAGASPYATPNHRRNARIRAKANPIPSPSPSPNRILDQEQADQAVLYKDGK